MHVARTSYPTEKLISAKIYVQRLPKYKTAKEKWIKTIPKSYLNGNKSFVKI